MADLSSARPLVAVFVVFGGLGAVRAFGAARLHGMHGDVAAFVRHLVGAAVLAGLTVSLLLAPGAWVGLYSGIVSHTFGSS